ncbi:MAG: hypothetical protein ACI9WS_000899 [Paraglaciecola psychrophila]
MINDWINILAKMLPGVIHIQVTIATEPSTRYHWPAAAHTDVQIDELARRCIEQKKPIEPQQGSNAAMQGHQLKPS